MQASLLIALIPALAWGATGIVTTKMGGSAGQQSLGMTFGALIFGILTLVLYVIPSAGFDFAMNPRLWVVGFVSGLFWAVGTAGQFIGFKKMGVSVGNPISTGGQIVSNALMAAAVLGEWTTGKMWLFGSLAILSVVVGAILTSLPDAKTPKVENPNYDFKAGLLAMLISTLGFMMYFVLPNLLFKLGYISSAIHGAPNGNGLYYMTAVVGPQSIGQVLGAFIIVIFFLKERSIMFELPTWRNIVTGLVWAVGNVFMFVSAANPAVGQAVATTLSQMGVVVGVFGGIFILGEKKSKRQLVYAVIGSLLVVLGGIMISNLGIF